MDSAQATHQLAVQLATLAKGTLNDVGLELLPAQYNWADVEPAIFGALLEHELDPKERHRLGAHYTPREYVERLVKPALDEPLRAEWADVQGRAAKKKGRAALALVRAFHTKLAALRVLDPACGSGNFLYVALETVLRLEGEVLGALDRLGETQEPLHVPGMRVMPSQFLGIEIEPRAAKIAELVLWVGYLQWHLRTYGKTVPVLRDHVRIECRDALLSPWPTADFVIGNPPFLGNKRMRAVLGDAYVDTLRSVATGVPESADYVSYWWAHAATLLRRGELRRFGLITTNSLRQTYGQQMVREHLHGDEPLSLVYAMPDHPWIDATSAAAVRVAMTVVAPGTLEGTLVQVTETDAGLVVRERRGRISEQLALTQPTEVRALRANAGLGFRGVTLVGDGFLLEPDSRLAASPRARTLVGAKALLGTGEPRLVLDLFGLAETEAEAQYPAELAHLRQTVLPCRVQQKRAAYADAWWIFAEPRSAFRTASQGLARYIATVETSRHRFFTFVDGQALPEQTLVAIAKDDATMLGVLGSRVHCVWAAHTGSRLGAGNDLRYTIARCFDPFPFPERAAASIGELAEVLDAFRTHGPPVTAAYNVMAKLRAGEPLVAKEAPLEEHATELLRLHDALDAAVLDAYGWPHDEDDETLLARLVALNAVRSENELNAVRSADELDG